MVSSGTSSTSFFGEGVDGVVVAEADALRGFVSLSLTCFGALSTGFVEPTSTLCAMRISAKVTIDVQDDNI